MKPSFSNPLNNIFHLHLFLISYELIKMFFKIFTHLEVFQWEGGCAMVPEMGVCLLFDCEVLMYSLEEI